MAYEPSKCTARPAIFEEFSDILREAFSMTFRTYHDSAGQQNPMEC